MQRYSILDNLGNGTYGSVYKAVNRIDGKTVAIKRLVKKFYSWSDCILLRELESLRSLSQHPNIVQVHEVIREDDSKLHFVFEFMPDGSLFDLIQSYTLETFSNPRKSKICQDVRKINKFKSIAHQVLQGLSFIHSNGYVHRDIKPENILLKGDTCKLADFGMTRKITNDFSSFEQLTEYVSTRWYRAPELLLRCPKYGAPIDIFAAGCVFAEIMTLKPLFPGKSEIDQISRITCLLGSPKNEGWTEGHERALKMNFNFSRDECHDQMEKQTFNDYLNRNIPHEFTALLSGMLRLNPKNRLTASKALQLPSISFIPTSYNQHHISKDYFESPKNACDNISNATYLSNQRTIFNKSPDFEKENIFSKCTQQSLISTPTQNERKEPSISNHNFDSRRTTPSLESEYGYSPVHFQNPMNICHSPENLNNACNTDADLLNISSNHNHPQRSKFQNQGLNIQNTILNYDFENDPNCNRTFNCPLELRCIPAQSLGIQDISTMQKVEDRESYRIRRQNQERGQKNEFAECIIRSSSSYLRNHRSQEKHTPDSNAKIMPCRRSLRAAGIGSIIKPYTISPNGSRSLQNTDKNFARGFGKRKFR